MKQRITSMKPITRMQRMAWFALFVMLVFTLTDVVTERGGEQRVVRLDALRRWRLILEWRRLTERGGEQRIVRLDALRQ